MALAEQMGIELVNVVQLLAADVALPRIALAVAALVQKVERLVGELDAAEMAREYLLAVQLQLALLSRRRDRSVADGRRGAVTIVTAARWRCGRGGARAAAGGATCPAAVQHRLRQTLQLVLQRRRIPRDPIVRLCADTSLQVLTQQRFEGRDLRGRGENMHLVKSIQCLRKGRGSKP